MYAIGDGVEKDAAEAVRYYRLAAEQGEFKSQCNLGLMYVQGLGVPKDHVLAYAWAYLGAANAGDEEKESVEIREDIGKSLPSAKRLKAEALARKWLKDGLVRELSR